MLNMCFDWFGSVSSSCSGFICGTYDCRGGALLILMLTVAVHSCRRSSNTSGRGSGGSDRNGFVNGVVRIKVFKENTE